MSATLTYSSGAVRLKISGKTVAYYSGKHAKTIFDYLARELPPSWIIARAGNTLKIRSDAVPQVAYFLIMLRRSTQPEKLLPYIGAILEGKMPIEVIMDELYEAARELDEKVPGVGKKDVLDILGMPYREIVRRAARRFGVKVRRVIRNIGDVLPEVEMAANVIGLGAVDWHAVIEYLDDMVDLSKMKGDELKAYMLAAAMKLFPSTGMIHRAKHYRKLGLPSWVGRAVKIYYSVFYRK